MVAKLSKLSSMSRAYEDEAPIIDEEAPADDIAPKATVDEFEALAEIVQEQAPPSIHEEITLTTDNEAAATPDAAKTNSATSTSTTSTSSTSTTSDASVNDKTSKIDKKTDDVDEAMNELAQQIANEKGISVEEAQDFLARQAKINLIRQATGVSEKDAQKIASQGEAANEIARGGGGGIGSIVGGVRDLVSGTADLFLKKPLGFVGKAASSLKTDLSHEAMPERMLKHWYGEYNRSLADYENAGLNLSKKVAEFNAAFLKTEAASRLREMAQHSGQDLDGYLADLKEGKIKSEEATKELNSALSDPKVKSAAEGMQAAERKLKGASYGITSNLKSLANNFSDQVNIPLEARRAEEAVEKVEQVTKKPIYEAKEENEGGQDLKSRLQAIADAIRQMIQNLVSKFTGPKAA